MDFTASEIAGMGVGTLLVMATLAAPKVDLFIAKQQRRLINLCEECGGVKSLPCKSCRGRGQAKVSTALPWESKMGPTCGTCRGRGQLPCPACAKSQ